MSVNSLSNFGVPGLSSADRSPQLQPILTYKYRAQFYGFGANFEPAPYAMTRQIRSVSLPSVKFPEVKLASYVSVVYVPGRPEFDTMKIVFNDDISNAVKNLIEGQVSRQHNFYDQTESRAGENFKFEMDVDILAGGGTAGSSASDPNIIRRYCYAGCHIQDVSEGDLTYEQDSEQKTIEVTVRYDNVITFNNYGTRMGIYSHTSEITGRQGVASTGIGTVGTTGVSVSGASVNLSGVNTSAGLAF